MNRRLHRLTFCLTLIVAAALALSACVPSESSLVIRASTTSTPTDSVEASSLCSSTANFIQQSMDGRITGCFRVPDNEGQSLVVSLQAYLENSGTISKGPTTSLASSPHGNLSLTPSSPAARPGATVTIIGRIYLGHVGHEELLRRSLLGRLSKGSRRTRRFSALDRTAVLSGCTEGPFDGVAGD